MTDEPKKKVPILFILLVLFLIGFSVGGIVFGIIREIRIWTQ